MFTRSLILGAVFAIAAPAVASAQFDNRQGFFGPLLSIFGGHQRQRQPAWRRNDPDAYPEITVRPPAVRQPSRREVAEPEDQFDEALGPRSFCVRTCDGFYFPIGPIADGSTAQAQKAMCARFCPASEVALYSVWSGGDVADAVGPGRRRYSELPTAFRFRTELSPSCTCNGRVGGGLASVAAADDFTLRRGDVVAGADGPLVFVGGGRLPFNQTQFSSAQGSRLGREIMRRFKTSAAPLRHAEPETMPETVRTGGAVRVVPLTVKAEDRVAANETLR